MRDIKIKKRPGAAATLNDAHFLDVWISTIGEKKPPKKRLMIWRLPPPLLSSFLFFPYPCLLVVSPQTCMPQPRTTGWALHPPGPFRRQRLPEAHTLLGVRRTGQGTRVRSGDGHRIVGLFPWRGGHVFVCRRRAFEAILGRGWCCVLHPYWRGLEGEGFGLGEGEVFGCELGVFVVVGGRLRLAVFGGRVRVLVWVGRAEGKAGGVGC